MLFFGFFMLMSPSETHAYLQFKGSALAGFKGALFTGGLGFLLDKKDENDWCNATPLERQVIYNSRKGIKTKNGKNK